MTEYLTQEMAYQPTELESIFEHKLYDLLKSKIRGHIFIHAESPEAVYIDIKAFGIRWQSRRQFPRPIEEMYSREKDFSFEVSKSTYFDFKKFVIDTFFITNKEN